MSERKRQSLNHLLAQLGPGLLVDSAWLQDQGISRTSVHDYVQRGWLERVGPKVYRRQTSKPGAAEPRWEVAVMSAQQIRPGTFYIGGMTALELLGQSHFVRLAAGQGIQLYDPEGDAPPWLEKLPTSAPILRQRRALFTDPAAGVVWHRYDLGTSRLGASVPFPDANEPWDHFMRLAGAERAAIEIMDQVARGLTFEHVDAIFEGLVTLRPRLLTQLLETCLSIRAKRLFLFFTDRHDHGWAKHIDRGSIDLGHGKRQLVPGGRLDARYQITVPATLAAKVGEAAQ